METNHIQFFTATILDWKHLLKENYLKDIIVRSLKFLVENKRVYVYGFVIMPNHIHLIWRIRENILLKDVQRDFLKFTAQQFKFHLQDTNSPQLAKFRVNLRDREYQFWQRNSLSVDLYSAKVLEQKLDYIHRNPIQKGFKLADTEFEYHYCSARFYLTAVDDFGFLTHYLD